MIITLFYNLSSNLQSYYLQLKNQFSEDKQYLAVINKNGLWIKDVVNNQTNIINSSKIDNNFLTDTFIATFNEEFELIRSLKSDKIDIKNNKWIIYDALQFENNVSNKIDLLEFNSNFDQQTVLKRHNRSMFLPNRTKFRYQVPVTILSTPLALVPSTMSRVLSAAAVASMSENRWLMPKYGPEVAKPSLENTGMSCRPKRGMCSGGTS